jgi:glycerophosphoryl diester phosphodiesterase
MFIDEHFEMLDRSQISTADYELALRHAPRIRFDAREPFLPSAVGYTVFREEMDSPSFPRRLTLPEGAVCGIEYAIWWDWDIQHLYELEHIWVYLDAQERVVTTEASWHGGFHEMVTDSGDIPMEDGRVMVFSESGKHAFAPVRDWLLKRADVTISGCGRHAGKAGVHVTSLFKGLITDRTPLNNQLVWTYLERHAFEPTFNYEKVFDLSQAAHVPWQNLAEWIPARINWWTRRLHDQIPPHERRVIRIAHRGASAYAQENSLAAIRKAAELGADMVEVDVRLTADRVPVIFHDDSLKRLYGAAGMVSEFTLEDLSRMTPDGHEPIVTLEALVETCRSLHMGLYLDIKQIGLDSARTMMDIVKQYNMTGGTIFGSFRPDWLAEIKANESQAMTSILFSSVHVNPVAQAQAIRCDYVHPCWERFEAPHTFLTERWLSSVRDMGLGVVCWHEERPDVIRALQSLGVNAICSDQPELLIPA